jgi:hypothetical protein
MKRLTVRGTALAVGLFFDLTFLACIAWGLVVPKGLHAAWLLEAMLPGFTWLTPGSVLLGLVEAFFYGVYVAVVFVPLFNYFEGGRPMESERSTATGASPRGEPLPHRG